MLSGLALDLSDLKGQFCGKLLRDLGLEVIKVEPPGGDPVRRLGPFAGGEPGLERSLRFAYLNSGKKSLTLDVSRADGWELLCRLAEQADVVVESGGVDAEALKVRNPRLVVTSVTGFGLDGPHSDWLTSDIVGFATGGLMYISGDASMPPVNAPETQAFYFASVYAALGTMLALWQRGNDGQGRPVDVSIQEAIACQEHLVRNFGFNKKSVVRHGSQHENVAPANIFPTKEGYVYLFVTRAHWKLLMEAWPGHPAKFDEPDWVDNDFRHLHEAEINEQVETFTRQWDAADLAHAMQKKGVPCLAVNSPTGFMSEEHIVARGLFGTVPSPTLGEHQQVSFPLLVDGRRQAPEPAPQLGQHTREILQGRLGLSDAEFELLFAQGVI